jgi:hypothetical protein
LSLNDVTKLYPSIELSCSATVRWAKTLFLEAQSSYKSSNKNNIFAFGKFSVEYNINEHSRFSKLAPVDVLIIRATTRAVKGHLLREGSKFAIIIEKGSKSELAMVNRDLLYDILQTGWLESN